MSDIIEINGKRFIFIHIPKTGGLSISKTFKLKEGHQSIRTFKNKYYSFAFVRNPWDRLISSFIYLNRGGMGGKDIIDRDKYLLKYKGDFNYFVKYGLINNMKYFFNQQHLRPQYKFISDWKGKIIVNKIFRFEKISDDFNQMCDLMQTERMNLPHLNKSDHNNYRNYYNSELINIVEKVYSKDIKIFNYNYL